MDTPQDCVSRAVGNQRLSLQVFICWSDAALKWDNNEASICHCKPSCSYEMTLTVFVHIQGQVDLMGRIHDSFHDTFQEGREISLHVFNE